MGIETLEKRQESMPDKAAAETLTAELGALAARGDTQDEEIELTSEQVAARTSWPHEFGSAGKHPLPEYTGSDDQIPFTD